MSAQHTTGTLGFLTFRVVYMTLMCARAVSYSSASVSIGIPNEVMLYRRSAKHIAETIVFLATAATTAAPSTPATTTTTATTAATSSFSFSLSRKFSQVLYKFASSRQFSQKQWFCWQNTQREQWFLRHLWHWQHIAFNFPDSFPRKKSAKSQEQHIPNIQQKRRGNHGQFSNFQNSIFELFLALAAHCS